MNSCLFVPNLLRYMYAENYFNAKVLAKLLQKQKWTQCNKHYADDTQIYGSCTPSHVDMFLSEVTNCVAAVADWMWSNRLQLNDNKTEFMWCTTDRRQHLLPTVGPTIGSFSATRASMVRDLGVYIDSGLSRPANRVALFCHYSPATHHPASSPNHRVPVTGYRACSASLRLL